MYAIISELKKQLAEHGINRFAKMYYSGDDLMVCCPYIGHKEGQERRPSAGIRLSDGLFHCLACGETHSLPEMIGYCFSSDAEYGLKWLATNFASAEIDDREDIELDFGRNSSDSGCSVVYNSNISDNDSKRNSRTDTVYVTEEELDRYRYTHKYMYERGLTDDIIDLFDIGYDADTRSITFPVKDRTGACLFVARRSVDYKRFDLPVNINKPLYGYAQIWDKYYSIENEIECEADDGRHYFTQSLLPEIYLCEGLFDCLRLWCNGKYAVCGFGCLYNELQMKQLRGLPTRNLILAFDNDDRGQEGAERIRQAVTNKIIMSSIIPINRHDIGECTDEEIQNLEVEL